MATPTIDFLIGKLPHYVMHDHSINDLGVILDTRYLKLNQSTPQTVGDTTNRLFKLWATDITVTNAINSGGLYSGTTTPSARLHIAETITTSPRGIMSSQHSDGVDGARFHMRKSRGTNASPTVITTGDVLGRLVVSGYDGTNYLEMGGIDIVSVGTIATGRVPTEMRFLTATNAATSVLTQRMVIDKSGNVGIGTTGPGGKLEVKGTSHTYSLVTSTNTGLDAASVYSDGTNSFNSGLMGGSGGGAGNYVLYSGLGGVVVTTGQYGSVTQRGTLTVQGTGNSSIAGNVGIGTTGPVSKLNVNGNVTIGNIATDDGAGLQISAATGGIIDIYRSSATTTGGIGQLNFYNGSAGTGRALIQGLADGATDATTLQFYTQPTGGSLTERVRIQSNGNVGIGTTGPGAKLDIATPPGTGQTYSDGLLISESAQGTLYGLSLWYNGGGNGNTYIDDRMDSALGTMNFRMRASGTPVNVLTLTSQGNVGIGTTGPGYKLDVNGTGRFANNLEIDSTYSLFTNKIAANSNGADLVITGPTNNDIVLMPQGTGNVGIGLTAPTAVLHLKACTATANTASLKIDAGTVATTPVTGNIESDGTHLYWTDSGATRRQLDNA